MSWKDICTAKLVMTSRKDIYTVELAMTSWKDICTAGTSMTSWTITSTSNNIKKGYLRLLVSNFKKLHKKSFKKVRIQQDSNLWTLRFLSVLIYSNRAARPKLLVPVDLLIPRKTLIAIMIIIINIFTNKNIIIVITILISITIILILIWWHPRLEETMVSAGDLGRILLHRWVLWDHRGCAFLPCRSLECCLQLTCDGLVSSPVGVKDSH